MSEPSSFTRYSEELGTPTQDTIHRMLLAAYMIHEMKGPLEREVNRLLIEARNREDQSYFCTAC